MGDRSPDVLHQSGAPPDGAQSPARLPVELSHTLDHLRRRIRRYVAWEGLAMVLAVIGGWFWGSFLIDAVYFSTSRLELPRWFRAAVLIAGLSSLAVMTTLWIGLRVFRQMRQRALALLLERRFPQLGESVITAVEAAEGGLRMESPYHRAMLERTMADAARTVERLDLAALFNPQPLRRAVTFAALLGSSIVGLAVVDSAAMDRWLDGFVHLHDGYWPRQTELVVRVLTQPGDRIRDFDRGTYRHPRGGDLMLLVEVPPGKAVPERVRLDYRLGDSGTRRVYLTRVGDQPFLQTFPALLERAQLWVSGGDFAMPRPLRVEIVDPPRIDLIVADTLFPAYTGLNATDDNGQPQRTANPVLGTQLALPLGSDVLFRGTANKPLRSVRIDVDVGLERYEWHLGTHADDNGTARTTAGETVSAWLTLRSRDGRPQLRAAWSEEIAATWLSADRRTFVLPLVLSPTAADDLPHLVGNASSGAAALPVPLPWPADALLRIHLEDTDGIGSAEPHRLVLAGLADQPPSLEVALEGVSASVTRLARIPVAGVIRDDYGVVAARFEFQIDQATDWQTREFARPVTTPVRELTLARSDTEPFERFDLLPLDLSVKQKLVLTVVAEDGDQLTGPHRQRSQKFVFTVVPVEELLSLLYAKELNLRRRFEQILSELKDLQKDLALHRGRADELRGLRAAGRGDGDEAVRPLQAALTACAERSLHGIRKNATETAGIAAAFREIRAELVNNGAETPQNLARLDDKILGPLEVILESAFPAVDTALGLFKLANDKGQDPSSAIDGVEPPLAGLIARMEQILLEMRKLETFHEALELLKSIIADQDGIKEDTKNERKAKALRALE
jgi:hypothetical protein